jgi:hypothetical protein
VLDVIFLNLIFNSLFEPWEIGSFAKHWSCIGFFGFSNAPMRCGLKLFFEMCDGRNFLNNRVGQRVVKVSPKVLSRYQRSFFRCLFFRSTIVL